MAIQLVKNKQIIVTTDFNISSNKLTNVNDPTNPQDAATKHYVDNAASGSSAIALTTVSGITSNTSLGSLTSGLTLGMIYVTNSGSAVAYINLGTSTTGNEINPYGLITVNNGEVNSITVNRRLSNTVTYTLYVSSSNWTNVTLKVEWGAITYTNQTSGGGGSSTLSGLTDVNLGTLSNNDVLTYSTGLAKWTNLPAGGSPTASLSTAISTEMSVRASVDTSLSSAVAAGGGTGTTSLSTALSSEISVRTSIDLSLSSAISSSGGGTGTTSLSSALSSEISIRASQDTSLSTAISTNTSQITSLSTALSTDISTGTSLDVSLSSALSSEVSVRTSVDTSLSTAIGNAGNVTKVGTPVSAQVAVWTGNGTIQGTTGLTWTDSLGIGTRTFDPNNPEKVRIDSQSGTSVTAFRAVGYVNNFFEIDINNDYNGVSGSSDIVATGDVGNENFGYINMGINSSGYTAGVVGNALDNYLYGYSSGNTLIGNATTGKDIVFFTNSSNAYTNERMRIASTGNVTIQGVLSAPVITSLSSALSSEISSRIAGDLSLSTAIAAWGITGLKRLSCTPPWKKSKSGVSPLIS